MPAGSRVPVWSLSTIYPGYESDSYLSHRAELTRGCATLLKKLSDGAALKENPRKWLESSVKKLDRLSGLHANLNAFIGCGYAVNTTDARTLQELNALAEVALPLQDAVVRFRSAVKSIRRQLPGIYKESAYCRKFRFFIDEQLELADRQMSPEEENLASDLMRAGGAAWGRLQETVMSNLSWPWEGEERKTVVELRSLAMHKDRAVREKAYTRELEAWESVEAPIAAALNGVKGFAVTLNKRRHYASSLQRSTQQARITPKTLDALIGAMEASLPMFRRYFTAKAKLLGLKKLAFYDLFAPVGMSDREWTFTEARDFIVDQFTTFSSDLGEFASLAFKEQWIDARPRPGKVGGAFCEAAPLAGQSRILANFDVTFDSLFTLAHELGHGYHGYVLKGQNNIHQDYPMTVAETASIFCETIVFNQAMTSATEDEQLNILETYLQGSSQVIVDILSRFRFESAVLERRATAELSPDELKKLMIDAQVATYGAGLDRKKLHPYMWAAKPHYYSSDLSFYNFPYAFGLLFGLGLYSRYTEEGEKFPSRYRQLLLLTGQASANTVTSQAGCDIEQPAFWQGGIDVIAERVKEFEKLVARKTR
ncbi:MAG: M3 family oligoendopeptidase [Spirochaetales bacterium]|nr:MAG: M3 family oligoendopeptidase [Spirochaetales bacterium]